MFSTNIVFYTSTNATGCRSVYAFSPLLPLWELGQSVACSVCPSSLQQVFVVKGSRVHMRWITVCYCEPFRGTWFTFHVGIALSRPLKIPYNIRNLITSNGGEHRGFRLYEVFQALKLGVPGLETGCSRLWNWVFQALKFSGIKIHVRRLGRSFLRINV